MSGAAKEETLNIADQISIAVSLAEGQFREFKSAYSGAPGHKHKRGTRDICKDVAEALVAFACRWRRTIDWG